MPLIVAPADLTPSIDPDEGSVLDIDAEELVDPTGQDPAEMRIENLWLRNDPASPNYIATFDVAMPNGGRLRNMKLKRSAAGHHCAYAPKVNRRPAFLVDRATSEIITAAAVAALYGDRHPR
jgi:hypothetical protein